jgi:RNA exonuclease 4
LPATNASSTERLTAQTKKGVDNDIPYLRSMILGRTAVTPSSSSTNALTDAKVGKYIALDCEMVGVGPPTVDERTGKITTESYLARVSLVNYHGEVVLDAFVKPKERVTDYRTHVSGVRPEDLVGPNALSLEDVQRRVADVLKGRILVGHAVFNDLKV